MEKDYITRTQKQFESYYQSAFSTQVWVLSITGFTLTTLFFLAGRFGFGIFDRKIDSALKDATAQLRTEFAERLANETNALQEAHASELKTLEDDLTKQITEQEQDLKTRSDFQYQVAQALAAAADHRHTDARLHFRKALLIYKSSKPKKLFETKSGAMAVRNIFVTVAHEDELHTVESAKKELADELYNDLEDELAQAALSLKWFAPILRERNSVPSTPVSEAPKTTEAAAIEHQPAATPDDDDK